MGQYDVGLACLNGHAVNSSSSTYPEHNAKFCAHCGEPTIDKCPKCGAAIRGYYRVDGVCSIDRWAASAHCHECGEPYPWTKRRAEALAEAIEELDDLTAEERARLKKSVPDLINDTPKSETAVLRLRRAFAKLGSEGANLLRNIVTQVATDAVKSSIGL